MEPRERQTAFERIDSARRVLDLPERASIRLIRRKYHELSKQFHPDRNPGDAGASEKQQELNEAYRTLMDYCTGCEFSFRAEDVRSFQSGEDFWWEHFGEL